MLVATIVSQPSSLDPTAIFMLFWLTGWTFAVFFLVKQVYHLWSNMNSVLSVFPAIFMSLFALPFIAGEIFGLYMFAQATSISMCFVLLIAAIINWIFYELLKAPTLAGRKLLDKIEGFTQNYYINTFIQKGYIVMDHQIIDIETSYPYKPVYEFDDGKSLVLSTMPAAEANIYYLNIINIEKKLMAMTYAVMDETGDILGGFCISKQG
ncbi:MAG: hypothetical protein IIC11_10365, partial [Proteobacteria bacterium]|nr:hypothetical protein [Pseudomonadota bacterium]